MKSATVTGPSTDDVPVRTLFDSVPLSSAIVNDSSASVKSSFTGVTVIDSVDVSSVPEPSVVVYVTDGTEPLKLAAGSKVKLPSELSVRSPSVRLTVVPGV